MPKKLIDKAKEIWSDFWLDDDQFDDTNLPFDEDLVFKGKDSELDTGILDRDTLRLASARRAIANFVNILTGEDIPVFFWSGNETGATDGKTVYLSADIINKEDFDPAVGLSLHEGSHIVLTDFSLIKTLWGRISELYKLGKEIGIDKERVRQFTSLMVNYVEDRYIDNYIFTTAPGYRPYYTALYDKHFNNKVIGQELQGKLMRQPTLPAYEARIINLTNPLTDLNALPGLRDIAKEISLKNVDRLTHTKDRIRVAIEITKIVFRNIKDFVEKQKQAGLGHDADPRQKVPKHEIFFDIHTDSEDDTEEDNGESSTAKVGGKSKNKPKDDKKTDKKDTQEGNSQNQNDDKTDGEDEDSPKLPKSPLEEDENEDNVLGGESVEAETDSSDKKSKKEKDGFGDDSDISKKKLQQIKKAIDEQKQFLDNHSNVGKKKVSDKQKSLLDIIEKSGIIIVPVGMDLTPGNIPAFGIECVLVKKMTKELMFSGMFPMCKYNKNIIDSEPPHDVKAAVIKGIQLGRVLGKKLQIRQEVNTTIYPRRTSGKIFRRTLHEIDWSESIFYKTKIDKYDKLNLHISVDASSSMSESSKWEQTMTMVVAICKAASMIDNLRVVVSFRCTIQNSGNASGGYYNTYLPYVICAYDSAKDKFTKINNLFPFLTPYGATPEGLAFEATMDELICQKPGELYYFLTISDGEPCFTYNGPSGIRIDYNMDIGAKHTRKQYRKIVESGVKGIAYFIKSNRNAYFSTMGHQSNDDNAHVKCFKHMYGKDAKFIDVNNVTPIARTMNDLFLNKD